MADALPLRRPGRDVVEGPFTLAETARRAYAEAQALSRSAAEAYLLEVCSLAKGAAEIAEMPAVHVGIRERARRLAQALGEEAQATRLLLQRNQ
jgi:poly-gamma-glutamate capsule biosynthesis protein CapA/YwtB (metallophosphatase superfamily)